MQEEKAGLWSENYQTVSPTVEHKKGSEGCNRPDHARGLGRGEGTQETFRRSGRIERRKKAARIKPLVWSSAETD